MTWIIVHSAQKGNPVRINSDWIMFYRNSVIYQGGPMDARGEPPMLAVEESDGEIDEMLAPAAALLGGE